MRILILVLALLAALIALPDRAFAVNPDEMLADPVLEARAREVSAELRCLVCQNQSIDDSNADLAKDLRILVRERIKEGDTNDQVMNYLVARYGEFVLLKPRFTAHTVILWLGPPLVLLLGAIGVFTFLRRRRPAPSEVAPLSDEDEARLAKILSERG